MTLRSPPLCQIANLRIQTEDTVHWSSTVLYLSAFLVRDDEIQLELRQTSRPHTAREWTAAGPGCTRAKISRTRWHVRVRGALRVHAPPPLPSRARRPVPDGLLHAGEAMGAHQLPEQADASALRARRPLPPQHRGTVGRRGRRCARACMRPWQRKQSQGTCQPCVTACRELVLGSKWHAVTDAGRTAICWPCGRAH